MMTRRTITAPLLVSLFVVGVVLTANPVAAADKPDVDGVVDVGEYAQSMSFADGDYVLHWHVDNDEIYFGIVAKTAGMAALGIEPEGAMLNADMIIGWVEGNGQPVVLDCFSTGAYGPHPADIDQGGTDDLDKAEAVEDSGVTTIEVKRELVTGDAKDKDVPASGELDILWAMSDTDDLNTQHTKRGSVTITIGGGPGPGPGPSDLDGRVTDGEYPLRVSLGDGEFELFWKIEGDTIQMAMQARTTGYVALGIDPEERMLHADMLIGWRTAGGDFVLHDTWSVGETGPHPDDTDEGGTYDILSYTATEIGGVTTVEFTRKLDTGDHRDKPIPAEGKVKFLWATSENDDFSDYHARRGTVIVDMGTGEAEARELPSFWYFHAIFMGLATIFFVITWFTVVYKKKLKKKYLNVHHTTGTLGVLFAIIGLVIGFYAVAQLEAGHFRIIHAWLGGADIAVGLLTVAVGQVFLAKKALKRKTRKPHIYLGAIAIILMAITALAGLYYVFP
jgi:hypothetical protein